MNHLLITIRFLDGRYHGLRDGGEPEWPPSPMRLFQALLAGAKARWSSSLSNAFEWLERHPPIIRAPQGRPGQRLLTYVPNNNSDSGEMVRTAKLAAPTLLGHERHVEYVWNVEPGDLLNAKTITEAARNVRALGWGLDLAIGDGLITDAGDLPPPPESFDVYLPQPAGDRGGEILRIPVPGSLVSLEEAYKRSLDRVQANGELRDHPGIAKFAPCVYACSAGRPFCVFSLQTLDEEPASFHPNHVKQLVGMIRNAAASAEVRKAVDILNQSAQNGNRVDVDRVILGHPPDAPGARLSILPLPSIGHANSDGRIRRVLLAESLGEDGGLVRELGQILHGRKLTPDGPSTSPAIQLIRLDADTFSRKWYHGSARSWTSVTPVLLPGYDDRRQHRGNQRKRLDRAEELTAKALHQAGINSPARFELSYAPFWPGTLHARAYAPREKLSHYPRYHVKLTFSRPLAGPLAIGAGRHAGFGVMAAFDARN